MSTIECDSCETGPCIDDQIDMCQGKNKPLLTWPDKIKKWLVMSGNLTQLKEDEMELRKEIAEQILDGKLKGTKSASFGPYTMTATGKLNGKLDKDLLKVMWKDMTAEERKCFKFDPKLVDKEYKNLDDKSDVHRAVELKPGAPTLKLKALKE